MSIQDLVFHRRI